MAQLLQNIYVIAPYILISVMTAAVMAGVWLLLQVRKKSAYQQFSTADRLYMKRNSARFRKMQLH
jgi:hypothetical protein